eukprot:GHVL01007097.1.p1 GENE.GHVL01007097.1~~GHVL01007097.1.p1  ORF type:complete len:231 (-),score=63.76 GHVL01007097.1:825-1517(-)
MVAVDMRNTDELDKAMETANFSSELPTLFIAECVLVYLKPEESDRVIKWAADVVKKPSAIVVYEQVNPNDLFGKKMVENLALRACPLLGLHEYPTLDAQKLRYTTLGWTGDGGGCDVEDMNTIYDVCLNREDVLKAVKIELFDEFEEWKLIQGHYSIAIAVKAAKDDLMEFLNIWKRSQEASDDFYKKTHVPPEALGVSPKHPTVPNPSFTGSPGLNPQGDVQTCPQLGH